MQELLMPGTEIRYKLNEHSSIDLDVIEASLLVDEWMEEFEHEPDIKRDRLISERFAEWMNQQASSGEIEYQFKRSDAAVFLLNLQTYVDMVKKKLASQLSSSPSTDTTSSQTVPGKQPISGSSETKYCPTANLQQDNQPPSSAENVSAS